MSAPVDVLAVLDEVIHDREFSETVCTLREARAAVAELIDAAQPFRKDPNVCGRGDHYTNGLFVTLGQIRRLDASLARIGGAA